MRSHCVTRLCDLGGRMLLTVGTISALCLPASGRAQSLDYGAFEQLLGEPVTTSATGKPQRASEVPANMEIITAEDIRRSGADNLPDILQFVAGLNVRRYGFAASDVGVRGYNETSNPRLLVLVNGQQVYLDDLGRTQWYTLPVELEEIRQIEIVKGPNTALFGFNAASGVVNIITYNPLYDNVKSATIRGGTQGYGAFSAVGTGRISDVGGVRVSVGGFRAKEFKPVDVSSGDLAYRSSPERGSISADGRFRISPGIEFFASGAVVNTREWEATASPYYGTDYHRTNWSRVGVTADSRIGMLTLSAYRNELRWAYKGQIESEDLRDTVYVVQASDLLKLGADHTVRIGLDYRNNLASSSSVLAGRIGYDVYSGSIMWDWQISPAFSLTNAIRYDHFTLNQHGALLQYTGLSSSDYNGRTINQMSFNSGMVWKATEADTFRLLAARGLQLPSIYDLGLQDLQVFNGQGYLSVGQPRLNAAVVSNVELDWDRSIPALNSTVRAAIFAQRTTDILTNPYESSLNGTGISVNGSELLAAVAANVGHSTAIGGEIGLKGQSPSGLRWNASYSYVSISDTLSINKDAIFSPQDYQHGTPTHVVVLGGGYSRGPWELNGQARWQSRFRDYRGDPSQNTLSPVEIPNYVTVNSRIAYKLTDNLTLALSAAQLNRSRLLQAAAPPVERRLFLSLTARY